MNRNSNSDIISFLDNNKNKIYWEILSSNPNENKDKINWVNLSSNTSYEAIELLKENIDKIDWNCLSDNPSAIEILKENEDKINYLSRNPSIFQLDYEKMIENNIEFYEELIKEIMKPSRIFKKIQEYPDIDYIEEMF